MSESTLETGKMKQAEQPDDMWQIMHEDWLKAAGDSAHDCNVRENIRSSGNLAVDTLAVVPVIFNSIKKLRSGFVGMNLNLHSQLLTGKFLLIIIFVHSLRHIRALRLFPGICPITSCVTQSHTMYDSKTLKSCK